MREIGSFIDGKYKILEVIGRGGTSVVYLAVVERANKRWAVKEVRRDGPLSHGFAGQSLAAEVEVLKKLRHPNLPGVADVIEEADAIFIVMDYVEGITLREAVERGGARKQEEVLGWAVQLCDVLSYLHGQTPPVIYRDMKPANIILRPDGRLVLIDFGTAREYKHTDAGDTVCLGTRGYAAPEQFGGRGETDERTDIYCLGATLYHLITGHSPAEPPFGIRPIRSWNPALSAGLEQILLKCTRNDPNERYASAAELKYDILHHQELDEAYLCGLKRKVRRAALLCAVSLLCASVSLCAAAAGRKIRADGYDGCMELAEKASSGEERVERYTRAVQLDPEREEAYLALIGQCMEDESFLAKEEAELNAVFYEPAEDGGGTCLDRLRENRAGYARVSYEMGLAYWYGYEEESARKKCSVGWFSDVTEDDLPEAEAYKAVRAEIFGRIGAYYGELDAIDEAGDAEHTYRDYWEDLKKLFETDEADRDNSVTALRMYGEMAGLICAKAGKLKDAAVSEREIRETLREIGEKAETYDVDDDGTGQEVEERLLASLSDSLALAEKMTEAAYHQTEEETDGAETDADLDARLPYSLCGSDGGGGRASGTGGDVFHKI